MPCIYSSQQIFCFKKKSKRFTKNTCSDIHLHIQVLKYYVLVFIGYFPYIF